MKEWKKENGEEMTIETSNTWDKKQDKNTKGIMDMKKRKISP
jgi:hypothetical protein